ncbi:unnamed protein product [Durusdinium trenchii]|uniref:Pentatricopeptide repeat-containing protein-mitochondrial domain-containing protein n=1 Tax=Durusdinium trenchii TaxID=1381693 RepID=A0ABP0R0S1_9DINO
MPKLASLVHTVGHKHHWWEALDLLKRLWHRKDRAEGLAAVASLCLRASAWQHSLALCHAEPSSSKQSVATSWAWGSRWQLAMSLCADPDTAAAVVSALGEAASWKVAVRALGYLTLEPKPATRIMVACGKVSAWQLALEAFGHLKMRNADEIMYNAALNVCRSAGEWKHALHIFRELRTKNFSRTGDSRSVQSLVAVVDCCGQASEWFRAIQLLYAWKSQPDLAAFTAAIHACEASKNWAAALTLFKDVVDLAKVSDRLKPDLPCFGAIATTCAAAGRWMDVIHLLDKMSEHDINSDAACRTALMDAFAKKSLWAKALGFLNLCLDQTNSFPVSSASDMFAVGSAAASCQETTQWERTLFLWHACTWTNAITGCLLLALRSAGKWFHSAMVLQNMREYHAGNQILAHSTAEEYLQPQTAVEVLEVVSRGIFSAEREESEVVLYSSILNCTLLERRLFRCVVYPLQSTLQDLQSSTLKPRCALNVKIGLGRLGAVRSRYLLNALGLQMREISLKQ